MNRKFILASLVLFVFCFSTMATASAQGSVGVKVGDSFAYNFSAYFWSDFPNASAPQQLVTYNETQWVRFTITRVDNLTVSYATLEHLANGTEVTSQSEANLGTGAGGFIIIRANVTADEPLYPGMMYSPSINETLTRTYEGVSRTVVRVTWNGTDYIDAFFDQQTGMPVELHVSFPASTEGTAEYVYMLVDTNIWVIPEFPTALALPILAAVTVAAAFVYRKTQKNRPSA